jgi:hypothetical protein
MRSRQPDTIATQCNQSGSSSYSLAPSGVPLGPVTDQIVLENVTPRAAPSVNKAVVSAACNAHPVYRALQEEAGWRRGVPGRIHVIRC